MKTRTSCRPPLPRLAKQQGSRGQASGGPAASQQCTSACCATVALGGANEEWRCAALMPPQVAAAGAPYTSLPTPTPPRASSNTQGAALEPPRQPQALHPRPPATQPPAFRIGSLPCGLTLDTLQQQGGAARSWHHRSRSRWGRAGMQGASRPHVLPPLPVRELASCFCAAHLLHPLLRPKRRKRKDNTPSPVGLLGGVHVVGGVQQLLLLQQQQHPVGEGACMRRKAPVSGAAGGNMEQGACHWRACSEAARRLAAVRAAAALPPQRKRPSEQVGAARRRRMSQFKASACGKLASSHAPSWPSGPSGPPPLGWPSRCTSNSGPAAGRGAVWQAMTALGARIVPQTAARLPLASPFCALRGGHCSSTQLRQRPSLAQLHTRAVHDLKVREGAWGEAGSWLVSIACAAAAPASRPHVARSPPTHPGSRRRSSWLPPAAAVRPWSGLGRCAGGAGVGLECAAWTLGVAAAQCERGPRQG